MFAEFLDIRFPIFGIFEVLFEYQRLDSKSIVRFVIITQNEISLFTKENYFKEKILLHFLYGNWKKAHIFLPS